MSENESLALTDWLENHQSRAEERMHNESLTETQRDRWAGEYQLAYAIQCYLEMGVLELE